MTPSGQTSKQRGHKLPSSHNQTQTMRGTPSSISPQGDTGCTKQLSTFTLALSSSQA